MSERARKIVFGVGLVGFVAMLLAAFARLRPSGSYHGVYGETLTRVAVAERHATDVVTAVNFDYRGFDTLGEEFILFTSVMGVAMLLRKRDQGGGDERKDESDRRKAPAPSDAVRVLASGLVGFTVIFGLYVVAHGQVTPGGGFQGGVVLATVPLVVYLATGSRTVKRLAPEWLVRGAEAIGAAGYVLLGLPGVIVGGVFLANVLPLGEPTDVFSSGTIALINASVGLEVAAGFVVLLLTFIEELHVEEEERSS